MSAIIPILVIILLIVAVVASLGTLSRIVGWLFQQIGKGCTYVSGCGCLLILILIALSLFFAQCSVSRYDDDSVLREGDILLQVAAPSEFVNAIVASSAATDTLQFAHCAMLVYAAPDSLVVLEATTPGGVKYTSIEDFLAQSDSIGGCPAVIAMRVADNYNLDVATTVQRAKALLGQPYDWSFLADNGKTYCSELIQVSYVDTSGRPLFDTIPLNFTDADGNIVPYWIDLFDRLGEEIPQGMPGTSPSSIARSECLVTVKRYF